ncbi:hypothetical protein R1sor_006911 [Riccia sorocarpa]|uniref:Uncharacterized protein n=1 Tax=Riccia sorocarpa TaxID=122646 RepID=A0ABD3HT44_9MARC
MSARLSLPNHEADHGSVAAPREETVMSTRPSLPNHEADHGSPSPEEERITEPVTSTGNTAEEGQSTVTFISEFSIGEGTLQSRDLASGQQRNSTGSSIHQTEITWKDQEKLIGEVLEVLEKVTDNDPNATAQLDGTIYLNTGLNCGTNLFDSTRDLGLKGSHV